MSAWANAFEKSTDNVVRLSRQDMISINLIVDHIATGAYVFKGVSAFLFCASPLTQNCDLLFKNEPSDLLLHFKAQVDGITGALGYFVPISDLRIVVHVFLLSRLLI